MNTLDAIRARHSSRGFTDRQIPDAELETILFAGGQAAVGGADFKSMKLFAVQDPALLQAIDEASAKKRPGSHPLYGAPTLVVLASKKSILPSIEFTNAGCVIQNMMIAAADLGIDSIYLWMSMYGINEDPELMKRLGFPEEYTCVGTMALGYEAKEVPKLKADEQRIEVTYVR
ncbi:MAG: nitroreductase family protein [Oscillospiraceae bacterium]|nr:nitroreductase family protein [Oscillospiraceae bacterium]